MSKRPEKPAPSQAASQSPPERDEQELGEFGAQLRRLFSDTVKEPIPKSMLDLLDELEQKDAEGDDRSQ